MRKKITIIAGVGTAFVAGALLSPIGLAGAGHSTTVLTAQLRGSQEISPVPTNDLRVGDRNGTGEAYVFGIDGDATTLCYVLTVENIVTATAAHIHEAPRGANGPVVANLAAPADGNAADCLTEGEVGPGTTPKFPTGQAGIVADILANPQDYYVNVHNAEFPNGALRGQLDRQN